MSIFLIIWGAFIVISILLAMSKNRGVIRWGICAAFFGLFAVIVLLFLGRVEEEQPQCELHLRYQANSIKTRRVISYLTLAENVLRHSPLILKRTVLSTILNHLARTYQNMVLVY